MRIVRPSETLCNSCPPARQADEDLVRRRPRRGRLRLDARIDERVDDGRALLRHAPRAQAPPQRPLLAHQLLCMPALLSSLPAGVQVQLPHTA